LSPHRYRIALLFHEADRGRALASYIVHYFADVWREQGHTVSFSFGVDDFVPADIALLHIDLSVVPEAYLTHAARYPVALNGTVRDIRKSTFSRQLIAADDSWDGPVIVKSDLNCSGRPERTLRRAAAAQRSSAHRLLNRWQEWREGLSSLVQPYRIYERLDTVPGTLRTDARFVIERFLPEHDDDGYHLRVYHFLGDRSSCARLTGATPIVEGASAQRVTPIEPHPDIVAMRERLGFDYGKFDYVINDGRPVLLDVNKTTAHADLPPTPERLARWRARADGIFSYLER